MLSHNLNKIKSKINLHLHLILIEMESLEMVKKYYNKKMITLKKVKSKIKII